MDDAIFHLALPDDWRAADGGTPYTVSTRGLDLAEVGFIHCSTLGQLEGVANGFYADVDELVVLTIDPDLLDVDVRWEPPAPGLEERFPHVYGPLPQRAVVATRTWRRGSDGWAIADLGGR